AHQPERQQHRGLAAGAIRIAADDEGAEWPGEKSGAEGRERREQARARRVRREEGPADLRREERVGDEVVELDRIPGDDGGDLSCGQMIWRWSGAHVPGILERAASEGFDT